jgi:succinyl-CoA synthetase beta subunit
MPEEVFSAAQAAAARKRLKRIVMKLEDPSQAHKTEAGLVRLNIGDDKTARDVFDGLRARAVSQGARVTVQRQIDQGVEVLVGCTVDNELGRIVTIGPGGVLAELVDDVVSTLVPVRADWVQKLISETRLGRLLAGYRGGPAADINALCRLIEAVTIVFAESADLIELEINPVIVLPVGQGAWAVDALGVVAIAGEPLQT